MLTVCKPMQQRGRKSYDEGSAYPCPRNSMPPGIMQGIKPGLAHMLEAFGQQSSFFASGRERTAPAIQVRPASADRNCEKGQKQKAHAASRKSISPIRPTSPERRELRTNRGTRLVFALWSGTAARMETAFTPHIRAGRCHPHCQNPMPEPLPQVTPECREHESLLRRLTPWLPQHSQAWDLAVCDAASVRPPANRAGRHSSSGQPTPTTPKWKTDP